MAIPTYQDVIDTIKATAAARTSAVDEAIKAATESLTGGFDTSIGKVSELRRSPTYDPVKQASSVWGGMVAPSVKDIIDTIISTEQRRGGGWTPSAGGSEIVEGAFKSMLPASSEAARSARAGGESLALQEADLGTKKGLSLADLAKSKAGLLSDIQSWEGSLLSGAMGDEMNRINALKQSLMPYMLPKDVAAMFPDMKLNEGLISKGNPLLTPQDYQYGGGGAGAGGGTSTGDYLKSIADMMTLSSSIDDNPWNIGKQYTSYGTPNPFGAYGDARGTKMALSTAIKNAVVNLNRKRPATTQRYF
jgi:hypothetical protein